MGTYYRSVVVRRRSMPLVGQTFAVVNDAPALDKRRLSLNRQQQSHNSTASFYADLIIQNDPYMEANTSIGNLGWANAFIIFPLIILANDFLHFLPSGAPFTKY